MESQELLSLIKQLIGEIDERSEMDFRYSFARYILETWLEWGRHAGEGAFHNRRGTKRYIIIR